MPIPSRCLQIGDAATLFVIARNLAFTLFSLSARGIHLPGDWADERPYESFRFASTTASYFFQQRCVIPFGVLPLPALAPVVEDLGFDFRKVAAPGWFDIRDTDGPCHWPGWKAKTVRPNSFPNWPETVCSFALRTSASSIRGVAHVGGRAAVFECLNSADAAFTSAAASWRCSRLK